jgi:hypothetical protein
MAVQALGSRVYTRLNNRGRALQLPPQPWSAFVGAVDIPIAARFLGKLFGASAQSAFVNFIYAVVDVGAPFQGISETADEGEQLRERTWWPSSSTR